MKIKLLSDLHLEGCNNFINPRFLTNDCDVLVLAGDIATHQINAVLEEFAKHYMDIIFVPGNHEWYHASFNKDFALPNNVHMLNPGFKKIQDVTFIGATLWTDFHSDPIAELTAKSMINDFRVIKDFSTSICIQENIKHKKFIKDAHATLSGKKIIVSHFLPAQACTSPRFRNQGALNKYFANDMDEYISDLGITWLFGHTHDSIDIDLGNSRLVANPYGYSREVNPNFEWSKIIEV